MFRDSKLVVVFAFVMACMVADARAHFRPFVISAPSDAEHASPVVRHVINAYRQVGIDAKIQYLPAKRALLEAQKNKRFDAELARIAMAGSGLQHMLRVPVAVHEIRFQLVKLARPSPYPTEPYQLDSSELDSAHSVSYLKSRRLGAIRGVICTDHLLADLDVIFANDVLHAIDLLKAGRVDLVIMPKGYEQVIQAKRPSLALDDIVSFDAPIEPMKLYHYMHQRHEGLVTAMTEALSRETGNPLELMSAAPSHACRFHQAKKSKATGTNTAI